MKTITFKRIKSKIKIYEDQFDTIYVYIIHYVKKYKKN